MAFARGKKAYGFSDRSGFRYPLSDLVDEYRNGRPTGFKVGRDEVDEDHPQLDVERLRTNEGIALRDPRPDRTPDGFWGFRPVGNPAQFVNADIGFVAIQAGIAGKPIFDGELAVYHGLDLVVHGGDVVMYERPEKMVTHGGDVVMHGSLIVTG